MHETEPLQALRARAARRLAFGLAPPSTGMVTSRFLKQFDMTENLHNDVQMRKPISFRLDLESHRTLTQRAAELDMSPHRLAQHYVIQHLAEEEERAALHDAIAFLHQELVDLRKDFLSVKEALLASAGHASPEEAAPWVNMHYRPPSDD